MKKIILIALICSLILSACESVVTGEPTLAPTKTNTATLVPSSTPTPTPTPVPFEGSLFFDMNGSGLQDEATFVYDSARLTDERQPLQPDLLKVINDYVNANPDLKGGELITIEEPGLSGYEVCVTGKCNTTDAEGKFSIENPEILSTTKLKITDPNAGILALEMRYINQWNGPVVIPAYEMNGVQVPEQQLYDSKTIPINEGIEIAFNKQSKIGLMQGIFNRPFCESEQIPEIIFNYFDIDGNSLWTGNGSVMNYLGDKTRSTKKLNPGTNDSHQADDYSLPMGTFIYAAADGEVTRINEQNGVNVLISYLDDKLRTEYGHLDQRIILNNGKFSTSIQPVQNVFRGQIIALSSNSGDISSYWFGERIPLLHFGLYKVMPENLEGDPSIDFFRNVSGIQAPLASEISYWTVDNDPMNLYVCK